MIDTPRIVTTEPMYYAAIPLQIPVSEIGKIMHPTLMEVMNALAAQGIAPAGPWFTHHFRRPTDTFDFEVAVPTAAPSAPAGRVQARFAPAAKVARTIYHGSYQELAHSWGELRAWIDSQSLSTEEDFWEVYLTNPATEPDPAKWQTQLNWTLA